MSDNTSSTVHDPQPNTSPSSPGNSTGGGPRNPEGEITQEQAQAEGLPEQKHAGAVGYGPEYASKNRATVGEKITGIKEQVIGKVTKNPDLAQQGHDRRTGELKRREREQNDTDPFADPGAKDAPSDSKEQNETPSTNENSNTAPGLGNGGSSVVDTAPGQGRIQPGSSHPEAQDEGVQQAAAI